MTDDALIKALGETADARNDALEVTLRGLIGDLEMRVNARLSALERRVELPRRMIAFTLSGVGFIVGGIVTALIDQIL